MEMIDKKGIKHPVDLIKIVAVVAASYHLSKVTFSSPLIYPITASKTLIYTCKLRVFLELEQIRGNLTSDYFIYQYAE